MRFVRVVQREDWEVELIEDDHVLTYPDLSQAMCRARAARPDWIELGEVVEGEGGCPRHHSWTTLRRGADGTYRPTRLAWTPFRSPPRHP